MASSSIGVSSGSSAQQRQYSGYGDLQNLQQIKLDQRKRKRMVSNRESARRSLVRKQQHMDDLVSVRVQLRTENNHIRTNLNITTQMYLNMDAENSVLRAQLAELNHRLESLNGIVESLNLNSWLLEIDDDDDGAQLVDMSSGCEFLNTPWNLVDQQIMAYSADRMLMHCPNTLGQYGY